MRILRLAAVLLYFAASPTASLAESEAPSLDQRAQKLLRDIEARRSLPISDERWKFNNGPWAEYLDRYLKEGPGSKDLALLEKAWKNNDCSRMISLVHNNFVQRFPYLAPAHAKAYVRDYFKWTITYEIPLLSYCRAKAELQLAFDLSQRHDLRVFPFYAFEARKRWRPVHKEIPRDAPEDQARNTLCSAFEKLKSLALLTRHVPATRDLIQYSGTPRFIILSPEEEYLLVKIAAHLGLYDPEVDKLGTLQRVSIDLKLREEIDRFVMEDESGLPPIRTAKHWKCSEPRLDPFLKLSQHQKDK